MKYLLADPFQMVYAPIDLKLATIVIKDGYSGNSGAQIGAINNTLGYAAGTSVLVVDGFTSNVTVGDTVTIAGSKASTTNVLTRHAISAFTSVGNATRGLTITPTLSAAVVDDAVITVQPHQIEVKIGTGNLQYTEKRNIDYVLDRGSLDTVREGDEVPMEVRLDFIWEFIKGDGTGATTITVEDAMKQRGDAANWTTSATDTCEPYAVDLEIWYDPPCSNVKDEVIILNDFRWEQLDHNLKDAQVSVSGKCNVKEASITRVA